MGDRFPTGRGYDPRRSSICRRSRTCVSGAWWPTRWRASGASTSFWARWTADMLTATFEPVLTKTMGYPDSHTLEVYKKHGGYEALDMALQKQPDEIIDMVKRSGLRGRG